ncbi:hypothetical protein D3C85_1181910 [compost metagenome]
MKSPARLGPTGVERIGGDFEGRGLLAKISQVVDGITERGILLAALLGQVVVTPQALPQALAHAVDRQQVDLTQVQPRRQGALVELFTFAQHPGKTEDLGTRGDIEQRRAVELLRPVAAVEGGDRGWCGLGREAEQASQ